MTVPIKLLYAEDNGQDADLTRVHFSEHAPEFVLQIVSTGAACLKQIQLSRPDLLLLDHRLPDTDSSEILKELRRVAPGLPVVIVTGVGNEELVVRALRLGAANYVPKRENYLESLPELLREVLAENRQKLSEGLQATNTVQRILYVEHLTADIDLTLRHFSEAAPHFVVEVVHTCAEALALFAQPHSYDLALVDLRMPDQSGLDFVREAKRRRLHLPPFVIITGTGDEDAAIAALRLGAADYMTKHEGYLTQLTYSIEHAIAYARLRTAKEAVESATRIKSRFLDIAAHELRTPVTVFSLMLQLAQIKLEKGKPVDSAALVQLRAQAERLSRLVVDLLEVSRLERGALNLKLETTDIASLVSECLDSVRLLAPHRTFTMSKPEQPVKIKIDPVRIYQVVSNLIDNAIKYTPENTPVEITVEATATLAKVSVRDHGVGISDQQQASLFKPFSRGAADQEERSGGLGLGLGLFICSGIIELHGGTIQAKSKKGEGATFSFDLPRKAA